VNALVILIGFIGFFIGNGYIQAAAVVVLYVAWKNNYISNKGKKQNEVLKKNNLA
jgi:SPP1 family holin